MQRSEGDKERPGNKIAKKERVVGGDCVVEKEGERSSSLRRLGKRKLRLWELGKK